MKKQLFLLSLAALSCGSVLAMRRSFGVTPIDVEKFLQERKEEGRPVKVGTIFSFQEAKLRKAIGDQVPFGYISSKFLPTGLSEYSRRYMSKKDLYELCPFPKRPAPKTPKKEMEQDGEVELPDSKREMEEAESDECRKERLGTMYVPTEEIEECKKILKKGPVDHNKIPKEKHLPFQVAKFRMKDESGN